MVFTRIAAPAGVLFALTGTALAHGGHGDAGGFAHGFMHPFGGLDHVLVMAAVGLYAARLGGRALWLMPATFVCVMTLGALLGASGMAVVFFEIGIAISVVALGVAIALHVTLPGLTTIALVGLFAIFHGYAHGIEMPPSASVYQYASGFTLATALLHGAGIALGLLAGKLSEVGGRRAFQVGGGGMALAGLAIVAGAL